MPQIVETNLLQAVLYQNQNKMLCDIVGLNSFSGIVDVDVVKVL
jgi:hypothetical protein